MQNVKIKWHLKDKWTVLIFFLPPAFSEYKACIAPACTDVTIDKSIGTIDPFSLSVQNEYIFIKVN